MEIYVFNSSIELQGILESYISLRWVRKYSSCGEFEVHAQLTVTNLALLAKGNIVYKTDDLEAGYIKYRRLTLDANGAEIIVAKGKFMTGYLGQRIAWSLENISDTTEVAIRQLVTNHCINPTNTDRIIPLLALGALKGYAGAIDYQCLYKNILSEVEALAAKAELGIRTLINVSAKTLTFDLYQGVDRRSTQSTNARAIFSKEYENVLHQEYTDSDLNYRNIALVGGASEGAAKELITAGATSSGINRYELFYDASKVEKRDLLTAEYEAKLLESGLLILNEYQTESSFESTINTSGNLVYKTDFDLGDLVTCVSKSWGVTVHPRITEVEEVYENAGRVVNITYGTAAPTLLDVIKRTVK